MTKGLTITVVFDAMSLNYGESTGNISELKKLSRSGEIYSYLSRQAIRYDIHRTLVEQFQDNGMSDTPLNKEQGTTQYTKDSKIDKYPEIDLFGYMKTEKGGKQKTRSAVVRISPAISLEPFLVDLEFGSNKNFADRVKDNPDLFQFEHHHSLYSYTLTIDLDKVGKDDNDNINISNQEKAERIIKLLDVLKILNRDIKGRTESLNPLFIIGGVYNVKNPFFLNRIKVNFDKSTKKYLIDTDILKSSSDLTFNNEKVRDKTMVGYIEGFWNNQDSFNKISNNSSNIETFFENIKNDIKSYYK